MAKRDRVCTDRDPVDLERIRAAAFATRKLKFADQELAIAKVSTAGRGEQGVAALIDIGDLKRLPANDMLSFAVLGRDGNPAGRTASFPASGAAKAIGDAVSRCS